MSPFISAAGVSFAIHDRKIVKDASVDISLGQLTVVVGPNGAGKSTLLKLLTGELQASSGQVSYDGAAIRMIAPWRLACQRAVMAQASRMAFPFTVYEAARLGLDGIGRALSRAEKESIVSQSLEAAGMLHLAGRALQMLSGGEQQRAQFARVLCQLKAGRSVSARQVLFLDEPVASLDLKHQLALMDAVRALADEGIAVLAVLHDLNLAVTYADQIIVMKDGQIVAKGKPNDVLKRELVADVFEVDILRIRQDLMPLPFVLPQHHVPARGQVPD